MSILSRWRPWHKTQTYYILLLQHLATYMQPLSIIIAKKIKCTDLDTKYNLNHRFCPYSLLTLFVRRFLLSWYTHTECYYQYQVRPNMDRIRRTAALIVAWLYPLGNLYKGFMIFVWVHEFSFRKQLFLDYKTSALPLHHRESL